MYLQTLQLHQFRNYQAQRVEFQAPKTILVGDNAQGKSNLLEAVELLATLRSHRVSRDRDLVLDGQDVGQVQATLNRQLSGSVDLTLTMRQNGRRTVMLNGETLRRQLDFLGTLNAVQFSCLDLELVRGGPGRRRLWLDTILTQLEPVYAYINQQYHQILRQRNAILRQQRPPAAEERHPTAPRSVDPTQLALWDAQLATAGTRVIRRRRRMLHRLAPIAQAWHQAISNSTEVLRLTYQPSVEGVDLGQEDDPQAIQAAFLAKLHQRAIAESYQGTTLVGPHRDEVEFTINDTPARQYGSQGQQRTLVLALKLAELKLISDVIGEPPLLLLDDVLAELDLTRQNQLLEAIEDRFQTLITTTHLGSFDAQWLNTSQILTVKAGHVQ